IVGRHVEPDNDGLIAIYDRRSLGSLANRFTGRSIALELAPGTDMHALQASLQRASHGTVEAQVTNDDVEQERADFRPPVYSLDAVLLLIGLVNLLTTILLGVRERRRDFGVFKVVGVSPRQILESVIAGGSLLSFLAVVGGIPIGLVVFRVIVNLVSPSDG